MVSPAIWFWGAVVVGTLLGPVAFTAWVRNQERYQPEPWSSVLRAFTWGASGAVLLAVLIELVFAPSDALTPIGVSSALVSAVIVAPVVEEATKGLGLRWIDDRHVEVEDGLVYGAAVGLGFSATENVVYGISAWLDGGVVGLAATVAVRTFTSSLLHATASALLGYGVWRRRAGHGGQASILVAYGAAVLLHAVFNLAANSQLYVSFLVALAIGIGGFSWIRRRVRDLDARA